MSHIGLAERVAIEAGLYRRDSLEKIAKDIGVKRRAVSEEIRRNRTLSPAAKYNGKSCRFASECKKQFACRNYTCSLSCVMCRKVDCTTVCPAYAPVTCSYTNKPPYVCNVCSRRRGCTADRAYYIATQAHAMAMRRFSDAHRKPQTQGDELETLDMLVSPLVKKGQPLTHIYAEHKDEIPVSERTLYRYIDAGLLGVGNLDLRRKVGYRPRRKKKVVTEAPKNNHEYRKNRTYEDFLVYLKKHPNVNYIEMDTVLGSRRKGKRMLTMLFVQQSLMLIFLMRDGKADSVVEHFDWLTSALGLKTFRKLFPVILTDNGSEFKHTIEMEQTIDGAHRTRIFYCDPQASWQKPHIEKNHEYIRYVIPKGKSMEPYTQEDFTLLANHINSTKRLQYGGKAPIELASSDEFRELFYVMGIHKVEADDVTLTKRLFRT
jgi:IS30 family transposase